MQLDLVGTALSAAGLGLAVFGVLRSGSGGWSRPKPGAPAVARLVAGGLADPRRRCGAGALPGWEDHRLRRGPRAAARSGAPGEPARCGPGSRCSSFQYLLQAGLFFAVPLFLSVALGLSAIATGVRLLPLSVTLLLAAVGIPKLFPDVSPRRVVRLGLARAVRGPRRDGRRARRRRRTGDRHWPMLLAGLGVGALASQLGSVTVSAVPDSQSGEVGGLQNTLTNLGASIGTALAGAVLIAALTASFLGRVTPTRR